MADESSKKNQKTISHTSNFQHEDKKKLHMVILFQIAVVVSLSLLIYTDWSNKPKPVYFIASQNDQLIKPIPLHQSNLNHAAVLNWFTEAVMETFAFNYKNKDKKIAKLKNYYTTAGLSKLKSQLESSVAFSTIESEKLIVSMNVLKAPEVLEDGVANGVYSWNIKLPIIAFTQNQVINRFYRLDIETIVSRVPETQSATGLLIDDLVIIDSRTGAVLG